MIIQCDHCQSRFKIADEKVPPQGAAVKCPSCKNRFAVFPGGGAGAAAADNDASATGSMPGGVAAKEAGWLPHGVAGTESPLGGAPPPGQPAPQPAVATPEAPPDPFPAGSVPGAAPSDPWGQGSSPSAAPAGGDLWGQDSAGSVGEEDPTQVQHIPPGGIDGVEGDPFGDMGPDSGPSAPPAPPAPAFPAGGDPSMDQFGMNSDPGAVPGGEPFGLDMGDESVPGGEPFAPMGTDPGAPAGGPPPDPFADLGGGDADAERGWPPPAPGGDGGDAGGVWPPPMPEGNGGYPPGPAAPQPGAWPPRAPGPPADAGPLELDAPARPAGAPEPAPEVPRPPTEPRRPAAPEVRGPPPVQPPTRAFRLLLFVFFGMIGVGSYGWLTGMTFAPADAGVGRIRQVVRGSTGEGSRAGLDLSAPHAWFVPTAPQRHKIFVMEALVSNHSVQARELIHVRGRLLGDSGDVLAELEVPCGNSFSEKQLLHLGTVEDVTRAYSPLGDNLSNKRIPPGGQIACTVVFFDAPDPLALASYELEITQAGIL